MLCRLGDGLRPLTLVAGSERWSTHDAIEFRGHDEAAAFLRRCVRPDDVPRLRRVVMRDFPGRVHRFLDHDVIRIVASMLVARRVRLFRDGVEKHEDFAATGVTQAAAVAEAPATAPPTPVGPVSKLKETPKEQIEIVLVDEDGDPVAGERYEITAPDGFTRRGTLDSEGYACVKNLDPGTCVVKFPDRDQYCFQGATPPELPKRTWFGICVVEEDGTPVANERYRVELPDGEVHEGTLDRTGCAVITDIDEGTCRVEFPNRHPGDWS